MHTTSAILMQRPIGQPLDPLKCGLTQNKLKTQKIEGVVLNIKSGQVFRRRHANSLKLGLGPLALGIKTFFPCEILVTWIQFKWRWFIHVTSIIRSLIIYCEWANHRTPPLKKHNSLKSLLFTEVTSDVAKNDLAIFTWNFCYATGNSKIICLSKFFTGGCTWVTYSFLSFEDGGVIMYLQCNISQNCFQRDWFYFICVL